MDLLFSNPYINIRLHPGPPHNTLEIQWLDFVPSADFRASMREMLHLARLHQVQAWVVDNRLIRAMRTADLAWSGTEVILPMSDLGVRRFAGVESQDAMNRMGVTALLADAIPGTQIISRFFPTVEEARAWATEPSNAMRTLLALPHLDLYLHDGPKPVLELHWRSYATSTDFRAALTQALRLSLAHQVRSWVADDRLLGAVRPRDVEWAEQELLVPLDKTGLERFAQLESPDALNRRTIDLAYTRTMPTLHFAVQRFEDLDQARAWASGRT